MKSTHILMSLLTLITLAPAAFANGEPRVCHDEVRTRWCRDTWNHRTYACGTSYVYVCRGGCAPEIEQSNVGAVQKALTELSQTAAFATATEFKAEVAGLSAESDSGVKLGGYLQLVGLTDSPSNAKLANFLGARTADPTAVATLQTKLGLSADQATTVVNTVTTALKGNLQ